MTKHIIHERGGGLVTIENAPDDHSEPSENVEIYENRSDFRQRVSELTPDHVTLPDAVG